MGDYTTALTDICFVKKQAASNVLIVPDGTGVLPLIATPTIQQGRVTFESLERFDSYSVNKLLQGRYPAGEWAVEHYMKRNGVADGAVGGVDIMLQQALGIKTINAPDDITYSLAQSATAREEFSMFIEKGDFVLQAEGCVVDDYVWPVSAGTDESAIFRGSGRGGFNQLYWAGKTTITEALATTDAGLTMAKIGTSYVGLYRVGAYITVGALTTSHKITDINTVTGVITVTPAFGSNQALGSVIRGFMPTPVYSGEEISGHKGYFVYNSQNFIIVSANMHMVNNRRIHDNEKNDSDYPINNSRVGKRRMYLENIVAHWDNTGALHSGLFFDIADKLTKYAGSMKIGNAAGYIFEFNFPELVAREPMIQGDEVNDLALGFQAVDSTAADIELAVVSK